MAALAEEAQKLKNFFTEAIDLDTAAFNCVMAAYALPKKSEAETQPGQGDLRGHEGGDPDPADGAGKNGPASELALRMAQKGNRNSLSDAGVAGLSASAAAEGAYYNVLINTQEMAPGPFRSETRARARQMCAGVLATVAGVKAEMDKALAD